MAPFISGGTDWLAATARRGGVTYAMYDEFAGVQAPLLCMGVEAGAVTEGRIGAPGDATGCRPHVSPRPLNTAGTGPPC